MRPQSPLSTPYRLSDEPRPGHRRGPFVATCEAIFGYPQCMAAGNGSECTCELIDLVTLKPVTPEQHTECERQGAAAFAERNGRPCDDCAFRPGSPEMRDELTLTVATQKIPFRCHQGMPLRYVGKHDDGTPMVSYEPRDQLATTYPPCNGWAFFRALGSDDERIDAIFPDEVSA